MLFYQDKNMFPKCHLLTIRCRKLLQSLKDDYFKRAPYVAYMTRSKAGLLECLAQIKRWANPNNVNANEIIAVLSYYFYFVQSFFWIIPFYIFLNYSILLFHCCFTVTSFKYIFLMGEKGTWLGWKIYAVVFSLANFSSVFYRIEYFNVLVKK